MVRYGTAAIAGQSCMIKRPAVRRCKSAGVLMAGKVTMVSALQNLIIPGVKQSRYR